MAYQEMTPEEKAYQAELRPMLVQLENTINTSEYAGRIRAEASTYIVYLYDASTNELLFSVSNADGWNRLTRLVGVMCSPSDAEINDMYSNEAAHLTQG
jgi:hypothetical protein